MVVKECKYCGKAVREGQEICTHCYSKLKLVRKLLKTVSKLNRKAG